MELEENCFSQKPVVIRKCSHQVTSPKKLVVHQPPMLAAVLSRNVVMEGSRSFVR